jgi:hypothetical protein
MLEVKYKALSGYAEWFWLIAKNWKDVENRNWSLPYEISMNLPYRIYLHASKKPASEEEIDFIARQLSEAQYADFCNVNWNKLRGHIIGETTIVNQMVKQQYTEADHVDMGSQQIELELLRKANSAYLSTWFFGKFGFVVKDGILYDEPIPCKGMLGFFKPIINSWQ